MGQSVAGTGFEVVSDYLAKAKLTPYLDELGLTLWDTVVPPVLVTLGRCPIYRNGNQKRRFNRRCGAVRQPNFEGRIHPLVKTNWLASPPRWLPMRWREI